MIFLQIDDSLGFGTEEFLAQEEPASETFNSNPRSPLTRTQTPFNGVLLRSLTGGDVDGPESARGEYNEEMNVRQQDERDSGASAQRLTGNDERVNARKSRPTQWAGQGQGDSKEQRKETIVDVLLHFATISRLREGQPGVKLVHVKCIDISTCSSIREMVLPGALSIVSKLFVGFDFRNKALVALLLAAVFPGFMMGILASNAGVS